jgi:SPP1 gp7 family putative phage head morphogenesis protein
VRLLRDRTRAELIPLLQRETQTFQGDAAPGTVAERIKRLAGTFGNIDVTAKRLAQAAVQRNLNGVDEQLIKHIQQAVNVNVSSILTNDGIRDALKKAAEDNINLITSIPEQYFEKLGATLEKNWVAGSRWEDLAQWLEHVGDVTESRAKLIARDQTSKMNGAFNEARQTSLGIEQYEWQTAGDERVRPTHAEHDGKIYSWDNPPTDTGHPGEDINCRCVAIPIIDLSEDTGEDDED